MVQSALHIRDKESSVEVPPSAFRWAWLLLIVLASALRLYGITRRSLWLDEYTSIEISTRALLDILSGVGFNQHTPPLYYLVLHEWFQFFPVSEFSIRLFSLVIDVFNVGLICFVFSRFSSRRIGFLTGFLYAMSPYAIYYAQEGRMYTMLVFWVLSSCALVQTWLVRPKLWIEILFITSSVAGLYTHYYFAFFLSALALSMIWTVRADQRLVIRAVCVLLVVFLSFLPWIHVVQNLVTGEGQTFRKFFLLVVPYTFFRFIAGYGIMPLTVSAKANVEQTIALHWHVLLVYFGTWILIWSKGLRHLFTRESRYHQTTKIFFSLLLALPPIFAIFASLLSPILSERYLIIIYPFFLFPVALFFAEEKLRFSRGVGGGILCLLTGFSLYQHYWNLEFGNAQWREVGVHISHSSFSSPYIYVNPHYNQGVLGFYLNRPFELRGAEDAFDGKALKLSEATGFWLVESGNSEHLLSKCLALGFHVRYEEYFSLENGIRVFYLEKD